MNEKTSPVTSSQPAQIMIAARGRVRALLRRPIAIIATTAKIREAGISQLIMPPDTESNSRGQPGLAPHATGRRRRRFRSVRR